MHLAELNIAEPLHPLEDPRLGDFVSGLDRVNAAAERSPGFVWRLKDDSGNATAIASPFGDDVIVNMSVWETPADLEHFVWNTVHKRFYNRRQEWFRLMRAHHFVMSWVEEGHEPGLWEAEARLDHLGRHGDSDHAFTWAHLPQIKLWQSQRCG